MKKFGYLTMALSLVCIRLCVAGDGIFGLFGGSASAARDSAVADALHNLIVGLIIVVGILLVVIIGLTVALVRKHRPEK